MNVAQQGFFVTHARTRFWVKAVTIVLKHPRNSEHDFGRKEKHAGFFGTQFAEVTDLEISK